MNSFRLALNLAVVGAALFSLPMSAAILGTNVPAQPLTLERIGALPEGEQTGWKEYLERSQRQRRIDQEFLRNEMRDHAVKKFIVPPEGKSKDWIPLDKPAIWYSTAEARHTADCILSFQTPAGGWSKNMDMSGNPRAPGMLFAPDNSLPHPGDSDFDLPMDRSWNYVGTFDNDATIMQLRFLAKVISAVATNGNARCRDAFLRGLGYIAAAQYPNGGWPQVWPLSGGYHDAITFNDNAMINVMLFLRDISTGMEGFAFVPASVRESAGTSFQKAMRCLIASQVTVDGRRTVWPQQCDMLTLQPCSARNYEMPSLASGESANIALFLMQLPNPGPETDVAVRAAAAWFEKTAIRDMAFKSDGSGGRLLVPAPGKGLIWARYYEIGTDHPLFGDRDKTIHDNVAEISKERRRGYSWFGDGGKRVLQHYTRWAKEHPRN